MLTLYRSGRQAEALQLFQKTRLVFVEELGLNPGSELQHLEKAILRQDSELDDPSLRPARQVLESITIDLDPDEVLFEQGDAGDRAYVVEEGEIEIARTRSDGAEEIVSRIGPGGNFGELAPTFGLPRSATARASAPSRLVGLSPGDTRRWLAQRTGRSRER